jgi:MT0933-like antitoxin protein
MGLLDDAKKFIHKNDDKVDQAIEKAGDLVDDKTGGKYADKVDKVQDIAEEKTGDGDTAR